MSHSLELFAFELAAEFFEELGSDEVVPAGWDGRFLAFGQSIAEHDETVWSDDCIEWS